MKYPKTSVTAFSEANEDRIKYLKEFRQQHRMTQADLANFTNTSIRTVEGWESRRKVPAVVTALLARIDELDPNI